MEIVNSQIEAFIRQLIPERKRLLADMEIKAEEDNVPIVKPEVAQLLYLLTKLNRPRRVLEIGTAIGYSTLWLAYAMDFEKTEESSAEREIITIEKDLLRYNEAKDNIIKAGLSSKINIIHGDALEIITSLTGGFDLAFIDAAKGQYLKFFNMTLPLMKDGGLIISDNVLFKGLVTSEEVDKRYRTMVKRLKEYLEFITNHPNLETVVLPVGDGIALSYIKR